MPNFAGFFWEKPDSGSGKPDNRSRNLFVLKHIWVKVSNTWEFQSNRSNNNLKPSPYQDGAIKKKFSQIGPAVPEEIGRKHTRTQASKHLVAIYKGIYISILGFKNIPIPILSLSTPINPYLSFFIPIYLYLPLYLYIYLNLCITIYLYFTHYSYLSIPLYALIYILIYPYLS